MKYCKYKSCSKATWGQTTDDEPDKSKGADQGVGGLQCDRTQLFKPFHGLDINWWIDKLAKTIDKFEFLTREVSAGDFQLAALQREVLGRKYMQCPPDKQIYWWYKIDNVIFISMTSSSNLPDRILMYWWYYWPQNQLLLWFGRHLRLAHMLCLPWIAIWE